MAIPGSSSLPVCCEHVASVSRHDDAALCVLANRSSVRLPPFLANYLAGGDEIAFPVPVGDTSGPEIFITKSAVSGTPPCLYLGPIGYVSQPKADKRGQSFVSAEVVRGGLGITAVYLPCDVLRDYFYRVPPADPPEKRRGLYGILGVVPTATPAEMRVAFKLRTLEMETAGAPRAQLAAFYLRRDSFGFAHGSWSFKCRSHISERVLGRSATYAGFAVPGLSAVALHCGLRSRLA